MSLVDPGTLIAAGSGWKYHDTGANLGTAWSAPAYDDTSWQSGPAKLGYGDGNEATVLSYGPDPNNKWITCYFRHTFAVDHPAAFTDLRLSILRDDGAVVYLNGIEVARYNLASGPITYTTLAPNTTSMVDGGLTSGTVHYYRVSAFNDGGESAPSPAAAASPFIYSFATGETTVAGTVNGTYANTIESDAVYQQLTEALSGGKPNTRDNSLEHRC